MPRKRKASNDVFLDAFTKRWRVVINTPRRCYVKPGFRTEAEAIAHAEEVRRLEFADA